MVAGGAADRYICPKTGLGLVPARGSQGWRIQKSSYGALNPLERPQNGDPSEWGRWDVAGHRTVYCASPQAAAYAESLGWFQQRLGAASHTLGELFPDSDPDDETAVESAAEKEFQERNHMRPGILPAGWRLERMMYAIQLPATGWMIDVGASATLTVIKTALAHDLAALGVENLTLAEEHNPDRAVTTRISKWLRGRVLFDGSLSHGIQYQSKYGNDWTCWAIWLRKVDDGAPLSSEPTRQIGQIEILNNDPDLEQAATILGLRQIF
jgi:RES domain-containing protein